MSNRSTERENEDRAHLDGIEDGAGCAEIWERLSERRSARGAGACDD